MKLNRKQNICSVVFFIAFILLVTVDSDNLTFFIIEKLVCLIAMIVSELVGRLYAIEIETEGNIDCKGDVK